MQLGPGFRVDPKDAVPVWRQIEQGVRRLVASGALRPGASLPSVREMARQLGVNPMTVSKAYQRLAEDRLLESRVGEGTFVLAGGAGPGPGERSRELRREAERFAGAATALGVAEDEAIAAVRRAIARQGGAGGGVS